jgi:hypothetical protein
MQLSEAQLALMRTARRFLAKQATRGQELARWSSMGLDNVADPLPSLVSLQSIEA